VIGLPNELLTLIEGHLVSAFAVFLRMTAFFALMPGFGEHSVPMRVKLALSAAMTILVFPAVALPDVFPPIPFLIFTEVATGVFFGLTIRLFVLALQTAGSIAGQSTSLAQLFGGNAAEPLPAMGHILVISGIALAIMLDLHVKAALFFLFSYDVVAIGVMPGGAMVAEWGIQRVSHAFSLAFSLAAPFIVLSVVYNLAIGAINKAMPQLMVAFVGAPLITAGGLILLLFSAPIILQVWVTALDSFMAAPAGGSF